MTSPFPGMDPYIESCGYFSEFHTSMICLLRDELNAQLPRGFAASTDLHVWVQGPEEPTERSVREPDVYVTGRKRGKSTDAGQVGLLDPETITLNSVQSKKRRYVKIEDLASRRVLTVIELLSPSNKVAGKDRTTYLAKRDECLASRVSFVEIDLLRGGRRLPFGDPPPVIDDHYVMICRAWQYPLAGIYRFSLREKLPEIPIPVTEEIPDVRIALQPLVDRAYEGARYNEKLDYDSPLSPRLRKTDVQWVRTQLASAAPDSEDE